MGPSLRHVLDLSDADWVQLERITNRFEEAWTRGERPALDDYLPGAAEDHSRPLLLELVHAELEFRLGHGEPVRIEEFLKRYPGLEDDPADVCELIVAEIELRRLRDPNLVRDEFVERFPGLERELTSRWETLGDREDPPTHLRLLRRPAGHAASKTPMRLGKFELLEVLGRGAFGIVYRAWDSERQTVLALKIPRSSLLNTREEADRFLREARSVSALDHPLIVGAYETGQIDDTFYLASELIQGATLADRLAARAVGVNEGAGLIAQVAEALHVAHQRGIIHRDLKPSNILIDQARRPHITDFGLAKQEAGTGSGTIESSLTLEGQVLGTPAYMSPELARGEARRVDAAERRVQPGGDPLPDPDRRDAVPGQLADDPPPGSAGRTADPPRAQRPDSPRPGDGLPEGDGQGARPAVCDRGGAGGGSPPGDCRQGDRGPAGQGLAALGAAGEGPSRDHGDGRPGGAGDRPGLRRRALAVAPGRGGAAGGGRAGTGRARPGSSSR